MIKKSSIFLLLSAVAAILVSCADPEDRDYTGVESVALNQWMANRHPELLGNFQSNGEYYVDVIDRGDETKPVNDTIYWVKVELTGRDLAGNVRMTRSEMTARQTGSFTAFTHYVPLYRYCGAETSGLMDGIHRVLRNPLTLGSEYAEQRSLPEELTLGLGAEVTLYLPSSVTAGLSGTGGYEGQDFGGTVYSLDAARPLIVNIRVVDLIKNPLEAEGGELDLFAEENGGLKPIEEKEEEPSSDVRGADEPQYNDGYAWRTANDTLPQLYINHIYKPTVKLKYRSAYRSSVAPYNDLEGLDSRINEALKERFGEGRLDGDSVKLTGTARIWYIGRFLDGFIFDTNIDEVKELIYGKVESAGEAIRITPETDQSKYVSSWYYTVPQLRYGQWAAIVGTSIYNYGASGQSGTTTTTTSSSGFDSSYYDMLNYYNYMNSYYGNYYYGGYYNNYYDDYYYGYYDDYYYSNGSSSDNTVTTTTVSTEIQSYTPLIFQFYIEEKED